MSRGEEVLPVGLPQERMGLPEAHSRNPKQRKCMIPATFIVVLQPEDYHPKSSTNSQTSPHSYLPFRNKPRSSTKTSYTRRLDHGGRNYHPQSSHLLKTNKEPATMTKIWQQTREHGPTLWKPEIKPSYSGTISVYAFAARISRFSASGRPSISSWPNSRYVIPPSRSTLGRAKTTAPIHQFNSPSKQSHFLI